jgi:urease accessory protein
MRRTQHGELELVFEKRGDRTVLVHDFQRTPLQIVRPFELEPGVLTAIIINPTAGVMAGDLYRISVTLREGARVVLLTQSATKIHRMDAGLSARQEIIFNVASGARLEYFPERTIPFADSSFTQVLWANLEIGAEFVLLESWMAGRILHGERLAFRKYCSRTEIRVNKKLEYLDAFSLEPARMNLNAHGALEGHDYTASGVFVGRHPEAFKSMSSDAAFGLTASGHAYFRATAPSGPALDRIVFGLRSSRNQFFERVQGPILDSVQVL